MIMLNYIKEHKNAKENKRKYNNGHVFVCVCTYTNVALTCACISFQFTLNVKTGCFGYVCKQKEKCKGNVNFLEEEFVT